MKLSDYERSVALCIDEITRIVKYLYLLDITSSNTGLHYHELVSPMFSLSHTDTDFIEDLHTPDCKKEAIVLLRLYRT